MCNKIVKHFLFLVIVLLISSCNEGIKSEHNNKNKSEIKSSPQSLIVGSWTPVEVKDFTTPYIIFYSDNKFEGKGINGTYEIKDNILTISDTRFNKPIINTFKFENDLLIITSLEDNKSTYFKRTN